MERTILHCDCNGFYASVECLLAPELKEVPMAVCGDPESRHGIILAKNELAKRYGIVTAETIWQAKRKCPDLVLVPPHHALYEEYSKRINQIYLRYTDQVEPFGIDESWLDVTGSRRLFGGGQKIADELRTVIRAEIGLTVSVGVSFNKIFAKLGSDYKKPDATTLIPRERFRDIVFPLPATSLLYVGKVAAKALEELSVHTIGDLAAADSAVLSARLGKMGQILWEYANGMDQEPVRRYDDQREIKSVGNGLTFRQNLTTWKEIDRGLFLLSNTAAGRMRKHGVQCTTLQLTIKTPDFKVITRQRPLPYPTCYTKELSDAAVQLIRACWKEGKPIRMLTVTGLNLIPMGAFAEQLDFFGETDSKKRQKTARKETAMDNIRKKYGGDAISFASLMQPGDAEKNEPPISEKEDEQPKKDQ